MDSASPISPAAYVDTAVIESAIDRVFDLIHDQIQPEVEDVSKSDDLLPFYIPALQGFVTNLDFSDTYVATFTDDNTCIFVAGKSLTSTSVSGSTHFSMADCSFVATLRPGSTATSPLSVTYSYPSSYSFTVTDQLTFAEIAPYPALCERNVAYYEGATFVILLSGIIFYFITRMRSGLRGD